MLESLNLHNFHVTAFRNILDRIGQLVAVFIDSQYDDFIAASLLLLNEHSSSIFPLIPIRRSSANLRNILRHRL
jgi:hypothetical protein